MGLTFTGEQSETTTGTSFRAKNTSGEVVVVFVTQETLQDYDPDDIQRIAESKYDNGDTESDGTVRVSTKDF